MRLERLLDRCSVPDLYSRQSRQYYSMGRVFDAIEDARERSVQKGVVQ